MLVQPPLQEPFRLDQMGRLTSPTWVAWLQNLVNTTNIDELFSNSLTFQSTDSSVSTVQQASANDAEMLYWLGF